MKKLLTIVLAFSLLLAVGCEGAPITADKGKPIETGVKIPLLSFDTKNYIGGIYDSVAQWMTDDENKEYAADVYASAPTVYVGLADTSIVLEVEKVVEADEKSELDEEGEVSGVLYYFMTDEQKADVEWYGVTDMIPNVRGKEPVAFITIRTFVCISIFTDEVKTLYYIDNAYYNEANGGIWYEEGLIGHYFGCMPRSFAETGYFDATNGMFERFVALRRVHTVNGKEAIEFEWSIDPEKEIGYNTESFYGNNMEMYAPLVLGFEPYENSEYLGKARFDLDGLKQMIKEERAK